MASLSLKNICKVYPNGFEAVKNFNLEIADQEFIIFVPLFHKDFGSHCVNCSQIRMILFFDVIFHKTVLFLLDIFYRFKTYLPTNCPAGREIFSRPLPHLPL